MATALIGYTGFVGSNLAEQMHFDAMYNSSNIQDMRGQTFDRVICAGVRAAKWWANTHPSEDADSIAMLTETLESIRTNSLVLISTVDVYPNPVGVDELTEISRGGGEPYGRHRLALEDRLKELFKSVQIIRLPALFGPRLKKNVLYDMLTNNRLEYINPDSEFQWYDLSRLGVDMDRMEKGGLPLVNFSVEPIKTLDIQRRFFSDRSIGGKEPPVSRYEMRSIYSSTYGGENGFMIGRDETMERVDRFIRTFGKS